MSFPWKDEHMHSFLGIYRNYESLWNNKSENYHKPNVREDAYKSILNDLNLPDVTVSDIKAKIKTIRTRYCSELAKIKKSENSGACGNKVYVPRLFWFKEADSFLRAVSTPKESSKDSGRKLSQVKKTEILEETNESLDNLTTETQSNGSQFTQRFSDRNGEAPDQSTHEFVDIPSTSRKRRSSNNDNSIFGAIRKLAKIVDTSIDEQQAHEPRHEFDAFCNSLAIQLKKMPLGPALICQEKLQAVMTQTRLSLIKAKNPTSALQCRIRSPVPSFSGEESPYVFSPETSPNYNFVCKEEIP